MIKHSVELKDVTIQINDFKVSNLNIKQPEGTVLGIVGRNGAGKSTIVKALAGIYDVLSGDIIINGYNRYIDEEGYLKQIGIVNDAGLFNFTHKPTTICKLLKKTFENFDEDYFIKHLTIFNIDLDKRLHKMSMGERKKVNIVAVLSLNPNVLILDEPMANIDPISKIEITDLLKDYLKEDKTIIYSTNQTDELDLLADYILFLEKGETLLTGLKEEVINNHYLITVSNEKFSLLKDFIVGYKKDEMGYICLINDFSLIQKYNLKYSLPKIEELMFYYIRGK